MPAYYILYLVIFLGILFLFVRYLFWRKTSLSAQLYMKGMRAENSGLYDEATVSYENALNEIKKTRFHSRLEIKIREKLKLLHTITTYERDQGFVRKNNSWIS